MTLLQHRWLNGWPLFFLIATLTLVAMIVGVLLIGTSTPEATVALIRLSVQLASPWIFIAFVTSPLVKLYPGPLSRWLARNRRYTGLSFAAGFGWQAVCIIALLILHPPYYGEELHSAIDLFLRLVSYVVLIALTVTSFFPVRRRMRNEHWRWLHFVGIWYFWASIWVSYTEQALSNEAKTIDFVYSALGLLVLFIRIAAYIKTRFSVEKSTGR
ncbi:hypothetical protein [Oceanicoccus sagamiensis]|uniref:Ferric oxidoreductase domain-containing protein n=1 Tax=Oceanicoccus sagamiensis TaxID=716816 RepID=A0A1X9N7H0_9GAMM|nr:hypothetical protein [Oceanicoccus sagamiensis]ARN73074.1 hypothetical protein BST96_02500 [Oceanicoccus sagamiensis]